MDRHPGSRGGGAVRQTHQWRDAPGRRSRRLRRTEFKALAVFIAALFVCAGTMRGAGRYLKVDYPASTVEGELRIAVTYTLWIPDGVKTLRGVIVHQHGAGMTASKEGSTAAYDLHWQALAKKWDCALLGPSYHVLNDGDLGAGRLGILVRSAPRLGQDLPQKALGDLRQQVRPSRTGDRPLGALGPFRRRWLGRCDDHAFIPSAWSRFTTAPARVRLGRQPGQFPPVPIPAAGYAIPRMCTAGVKEKGLTPHPAGHLRQYRAKGAPIGFAPDPRTGHECGDSRYFAIPFLDACLAMRLPDKGEQGSNPQAGGHEHRPGWRRSAATRPCRRPSTTAIPRKRSGCPTKPWPRPGWNTSRPAPWATPLRRRRRSTCGRPKGDEGRRSPGTPRRISKAASAVSSCCATARNLAQVPEKPVGKFGRPLFQSMTYHDTPDQPMPEMRYVDTSARADEEHAYAVISVNSVGLKSEPVTAEPQNGAGRRSR